MAMYTKQSLILPDWFTEFSQDLSIILSCRPDLTDKIVIEKSLGLARKSLLTVPQVVQFAALEAAAGKPLPWE